jgi:prevent-host-death family protein
MLGVREAKQSLSKYLNQVAYGNKRIVIHSRGRPKAALIPIEDLRRLEAMDAQMGVIEHWNGEPYAPGEPVAVNQGAGTVSDLVAENREPAWLADALKVEE